jgi:DNA ligase (NAD+)
MASLAEEIRGHDHHYYVEARPRISDAAYDRLYRRLQALEEAFPHLADPDSPTQRVGVDPVSQLPTVAHAAPMLSLDSSQEPDAVRRFDERVRKALEGDPTYVLEPKLDGASLELVYEGGVLSRAVTRGNGREGEGVTENVRTIQSVPLRLRDDVRPVPSFLSIRGEVLIFLSDFERMNERILEEGGEPFANPRNAAAGALRQLDSRITATRPLRLLAYDILAVEGASFDSDLDGVDALRDWGLPVPERIQRAESAEEILEYHGAYDRDRDDLDYEIDGVVIKLDDLAAREDLGATSHHPRWAMAFKFEPRKEVTRIDRIAIQVGRTGALTPVALLRPVEVGGVTVSRASLHNRDELVRKDIREGDLVRVQRAGDVIPQVVERILEEDRERSAPFEMPTRCPVCDTPVEVKGPLTRCPNVFGCRAQLKGRIVHFASRNALDIEGLGEETAVLLVEAGLVPEIATLFDLTPDELLPLPGFAEKSAENLVAAIQAKREPELRRFLFGLGIPEVGVTVARDLAQHFGSLEAVLAADQEALEEVAGVGPIMSEQIVAFLADPQHAEAIQAVLARGVRPMGPEPAEGGSDALAGTKWVFTGALERLARGDAKALVEAAGGRVVGSVSKATSFVVVGADPGSKYDKAVSLSIPVLTEAEFVERMREAGLEVPE